MAASFPTSETGSGTPEPAPGVDQESSSVVSSSQWNPLTAAALLGGAMAATAGAYLGAKAIARRNAGKDGRINSVLCTAITAGDMAASKKPQ